MFSRIERLRRAAKKVDGKFYGDGGTIHSNGEVNVEVDKRGNVVSVWFRCSMLPFTQTVVEDNRVNEMKSVNYLPPIKGIVFKED